MPILKTALCATMVALVAALAIPAIAQQPPTDAPPAAQPAPGPLNDTEGRGGGWRGGPRERFSDDDGRGPRWRRGDGGPRFDRGDNDGPRGWYGRRFGDDGGPMRHEGIRRFGMRGMCAPDGGRFGQHMVDRIERATQPTVEQRANFDKLKEAAARAGDIVRTACPTERMVTPTARLAAAEKRLAAMLEAVRTVRPAMDAFYGQLSDEQKARLALAQPRMGGGFGGEGFRGGGGFLGGGEGRRDRRGDGRGGYDRTLDMPERQSDPSERL